ncbi:hypothetical protein [Nocardiopsis oceani]
MEYAAVIVLVAAVAVALFMVGLPRIISDGVGNAVGDALGPGESDAGGPGAEPGEADPGDTDPPYIDDGLPAPGEPDLEGEADALLPLADSEDYETQVLLYQPESGNGATPTHESFNAAAESINVDAEDLRDEEYETELNEDGTAGGEPDEDFDENGLGPLVEGSSTEEEIEPLEWNAPDEHNEHGSVDPTEEHEETHRAWGRIATVAGLVGRGNAARNMRHFLENSGEPLEQNVDHMLNTVDRFSSDTETQQLALIEDAINQAEEEGGSGPYTFPIRTDWAQHTGNLHEDGQDWYYAAGTWAYSQTGEITVTREDDGSWSYDMEAQVHMRDQYDWHGVDDGGLGVTIPFIGDVDDEELAELHRAGLAQEFTMYGASDTVRRSGSYTSDEGRHYESSSGPGTR